MCKKDLLSKAVRLTDNCQGYLVTVLLERITWTKIRARSRQKDAQKLEVGKPE